MAAKKPMHCSSAVPATADNPRILGAFNEKTPDWLAFFMFTYFTDRDGKFQLIALAESELRSARAHDAVHADRGSAPHVRRRIRRVARVVQRTCEVMKQHGTETSDQVRAAGAIDLPTIQRYLNFHYSVTMDLFGADQSSERRDLLQYRAQGPLRGGQARRRSRAQGRGHTVLGRQGRQAGRARSADAERAERGAARRLHQAIRSPASGAGTRSSTRPDCPIGWSVPHKAFNRRIGSLSGVRVTPDGRLVDRPSGMRESRMAADGRRPRVRRVADAAVIEPGRYAGWIAPPTLRINKQPLDLEYVKLQ